MDLIAIAKETFEIEAQAIKGLQDKLTDDFSKAAHAIVQCTGKVVVIGMGKSGIIGRKIAATLASTGTASFFLHPAEAYHGDLGMISKNDVALAISNSGETDEVLKIIPFLLANGNHMVAITGNKHSTLAKYAHDHLDVSVEKEACPLELAPTSSTTATLAMGDALAIALMNLRGFKEEGFARLHPGGSLGRRLLTEVKDVMMKEALPTVFPETPMKDVIHSITKGGLGLTVVIDGNRRVLGLITDGDLRRVMDKQPEGFFAMQASQLMTAKPTTINSRLKLTEATELMHQRKVHSLIVVAENHILQGILPYKNAY